MVVPVIAATKAVAARAAAAQAEHRGGRARRAVGRRIAGGQASSPCPPHDNGERDRSPSMLSPSARRSKLLFPPRQRHHRRRHHRHDRLPSYPLIVANISQPAQRRWRRDRRSRWPSSSPSPSSSSPQWPLAGAATVSATSPSPSSTPSLLPAAAGARRSHEHGHCGRCARARCTRGAWASGTSAARPQGRRA